MTWQFWGTRVDILMKKARFTITAFAIAIIFWIFASPIHYFLYRERPHELISGEFNELLMHIAIVLLVGLIGIFADYFTNKIFKAKQLEVAQVYNGVLNASGQVLENLHFQMQLFKLEAQKSKDFDRNIINFCDDAMKEASDLIDTLARVENVTSANLGASPDANT
jgi:hypothetical protein